MDVLKSTKSFITSTQTKPNFVKKSKTKSNVGVGVVHEHNVVLNKLFCFYSQQGK